MSDYVVVVPKQDELMGVEWGFGTEFGRPDERTPSGVELYRRTLAMGDITFALLDKQTNTYSSILTADIIARETPRLIFLIGTALGNPRIPIGTVIVSDGVTDISEKRYNDDGRATYVVRGINKSDELTLDAKDFIGRVFTQDEAHNHIRGMARRPNPLIKGGNSSINDFIIRNQPSVACEAIVSGNEYQMTRANVQDNSIWDQFPTARAYDMEAAGFALAAVNNGVQWLVVRGVSDHGTTETKSDRHRTIAAAIAARFLFEFLGRGLVRTVETSMLQESTTATSLLRNEAFRLDGTWHGVMVYLDDHEEEVVFEEQAEFRQIAAEVQGIIKSQRLRGRPRHDELEYEISLVIARSGYASGLWYETEATRQYFGTLLGRFFNDSTILAGTWLGTHRGGVRKGYFKWYNIYRDGRATSVRYDRSTAMDELVAAINGNPDIIQAYGLAW